MTAQVRTGRCQCGTVRYKVAGDPIVVALCHCTMCRRANAAPLVAWAMFSESQVRFAKEEGVVYQSSPTARRGFCGACGTQIWFRADYIPGLIDVTLGSFDQPETLVPVLHYWNSEHLPWVQFADNLPRHAEFPPFE